MTKNEIFENITVEKLIFGGKWLATAPDGRKIILSWGVIPESIIDVRILKARKSHYEWQQVRVIKKSPIEVELQPWHQLYGGAKWLTIGYDNQLKIKEEQVKEAFHPILKFLSGQNPPNPLTRGGIEQYLSASAIASARDDKSGMNQPTFHPIVSSPEIYGYRNKVEFSWGKYISDREGIHDDFRFGFHAQGQFDRIENCTYCALADEETNDIFQLVNSLSRDSWLPTYDPKTGVGFWRHFVVRKSKISSEIMLIFSVNGVYESGEYSKIFTDMVQELTEKWNSIVSIYFLENTGRADIVTGNPVLLFGKPSMNEELLGLTFEIQPKSFFQVNTLGAEKLYSLVSSFCKGAVDEVRGDWGFFSGTKTSALRAPSLPKKVLLDLYGGTGTIGILLSQYFQEVYSVELVDSASRDGEKNAERNGVNNIRFINKKVEDFAKEFRENDGRADTIVIDPPRDGMHPSALPHILSFGAEEIIYVSCNPATLARDVEIFIWKNRDEKTEKLPSYRITDITPVDMFPHTHHIETVVRLEIR